MRILHVEDDEDTRKLVEFILHGKGCRVVSVENATSESIKRNWSKPRALLY